MSFQIQVNKRFYLSHTDSFRFNFVSPRPNKNNRLNSSPYTFTSHLLPPRKQFDPARKHQLVTDLDANSDIPANIGRHSSNRAPATEPVGC